MLYTNVTKIMLFCEVVKFVIKILYLSLRNRNVLCKMATKKNDWKDRLNVVYSTNPDFVYCTGEKEENETLPKQQQKLRVSIEKNHRGGKTVTLVRNFIGTDDDMKELGKLLKGKCGAGGSVKDGEILVQGDFKEKIVEYLKKEGYTQTK